MRSLLLWISALALPLGALPAQTHLVVVAGLGGEARYRDSFHQWATELMDAAIDQWGMPAGSIIYLAESTDRDPIRIHARSTKENLERVLGELAGRAATNAQVSVVLIGHGSARGGEPKLNLPGPDLTAADLAGFLEAFPTQTLVIANLASASGDFIPALSGPRRVVITATKSGAERNQARFGRFFVDALAGDQSDVDHDGTVSLLEAYTYARREVVRSYEQQGILLTEHALLDDNGDKEGSHEPDPAAADGALARTITLGGGRADPTTRDPELIALYEKKRSIEQAIAALQRDKAQLEASVYERRLEELLLDLAVTNRAIREGEGGELDTMMVRGCPIGPLTGVVLALAVTACSSRGHAQATLAQADSMAQSGEYQAAIAAYQRLLSRDGSWEAVRGLAHTLQASGQYDEAVTALRSAIADSVSGSHQLWNSLGEALLGQGRDSAAHAAFERAVASGAADRLSALLNLAVLSFERGRLDDATRRFDAFIDIYNRGEAKTSADLAAVADAVRYLGRTNPQLFKDALLAYDEAIAADPNNLDIQVRLGSLFLEKYVGDEATTTFSGVLERNPNHAGAMLGMARVKHFDGSSEAFAEVQRSLSVNPNLVEARAFLARLYLDLEDYEAAAAQAQLALAVNPRNGQALAMLAAAKFLADDAGGFAEARDSALGINPKDAAFFVTLSEIWARNRLYQQAVALADRALALDSLAWRAYALRGLNRLRTGAISEGRDDLETAFAGDPYDLWTKNTLDLLDVVAQYTEVRSPRFAFVLDPQEAELIRLYLEPLAEEAYEQLAARYGVQVPAPIRVEVYPRHADFSVRTIGLAGLGALGVSFGPVIAMDAPSARPPGSFHWGATFWHELAHTFHMAASGYRVPRWFTEGLAVLEERRARPGWGDDVTPGFLIAFRGGRLAPVSNLNQGFMRPAYPQQVIYSYYQSSLVFELIEEEYGFESVRRMLEAYRTGSDTPAIFRSVLDIEPAAFDTKFNAYLETRFAGALASLRHAEAREQDGVPPVTGNLARRAGTDTTDFVAQLGLGKALFADGSLEEALPPLLRAKALFPEYFGNDSPRWLLGQIYRAQGQLDRAVAELTDLTTRNAKHYPALLALAEIEAARGNLEPAAQALESLMFVYPYAMEHHGTLAGLSTGLGNDETALRERRAVVALEPVDRPQALYELAQAYQRAGNLDAARRAVLRALEEAPNYQDALDLLLELRAARERGAS